MAAIALGFAKLGWSMGNTALQLIGMDSAEDKLQATAVANLNAAEASLRMVRDNYLAGPASVSAQNTALNTVDQALAWLQSSQGLNNAELGSWGQNGISERVAGGRLSWITAFRDPIAKDPRLSNVVTSTLAQVQSSLGVASGGTLLIVAAVAGLLFWRFAK